MAESDEDSFIMKPNTHPMPMNLQTWIRHFGTTNRLNRPEPRWAQPMLLPEAKRAALAATLAEYQLGDGGGPCRLIASDAEDLRAADVEVKEVIDLWFAEEAEHSRLLGGGVVRLRGTFVTDSFAFRLFNQCRSVLGAQAEMQVLLLVEIVSTAYYQLIRQHCDDEPIADMCHLILRDEAGHVTFHRDRLAAQHPGGLSFGWKLQFLALGYACALFLWMGHGKWLRIVGARPNAFFRRVHVGLHRFLHRVAKSQETRSSRGARTHSQKRWSQRPILNRLHHIVG